LKIYLAARYSRIPIINQWAEKLQELGFEITSRWSLSKDHKLVEGLSQRAADSERERFALEDLEDIRSCDMVVSLMEEPRNNSRGGRHVEYGYAIALNKQLVIIGEPETVFHHLALVEHYQSFDHFLSWMAGR